MSRGYGRTIAPKTPINPCDGENVKCSGSSRPPLPSAFSICMLLSTTRSTFNAISSPGRYPADLQSGSGSVMASRRRSSMRSDSPHSPPRPTLVTVTTPERSSNGSTCRPLATRRGPLIPHLSARNGTAETWWNRSSPPRIKPAEKRRFRSFACACASEAGGPHQPCEASDQAPQALFRFP